jgi:glycerol-3-phosphate dehydrogenase
MTTHFKTFGVIGAGAWGTAIAQMLTREGQSVLLWALEPEVADAINTARENTVFLQGRRPEPALRATAHLGDLAGATPSSASPLPSTPAQRSPASKAGSSPTRRSCSAPRASSCRPASS